MRQESNGHQLKGDKNKVMSGRLQRKSASLTCELTRGSKTAETEEAVHAVPIANLVLLRLGEIGRWEVTATPGWQVECAEAVSHSG